MIFSDSDIGYWAIAGGITPYDPDLVNPASINLRLSDEIRTEYWYWKVPFLRDIAYRSGWPRWTPARKFHFYRVKPNELILCSSLEKVIIPDNAVGEIKTRSSSARQGLHHLTAGFGDPSFGKDNGDGTSWTFEFHNTSSAPVRIVAGASYVQMVLMQTLSEPLNGYDKNGRYNYQKSPAISRGVG